MYTFYKYNDYYLIQRKNKYVYIFNLNLKKLIIKIYNNNILFNLLLLYLVIIFYPINNANNIGKL